MLRDEVLRNYMYMAVVYGTGQGGGEHKEKWAIIR